MSIPVINENTFPKLSPTPELEKPQKPAPSSSGSIFAYYVGRLLIVGGGAYVASHILYQTVLSPSVNPNLVSNALFSGQDRDCESRLHMLQTRFFNHYEDTKRYWPLGGAAIAYLKEDNFKAFQCLKGSPSWPPETMGWYKSDRNEHFKIALEIIDQNPKQKHTSDFIKHFLREGMKVETNYGWPGVDALDIAIKIKDKKLVQVLLEKGASVASYSKNALHTLASKHFDKTSSSFEDCQVDLKMLAQMLKSKQCNEKSAKATANKLFPHDYIKVNTINSCQKASYVYMDKIKCWQPTKSAEKFLASLNRPRRRQEETYRSKTDSHQQKFNSFYNERKKRRAQIKDNKPTIRSSCELLKFSSSTPKKKIKSVCRKEIFKRHPDHTKMKGDTKFQNYYEACDLLKKNKGDYPCKKSFF